MPTSEIPTQQTTCSIAVVVRSDCGDALDRAVEQLRERGVDVNYEDHPAGMCTKRTFRVTGPARGVRAAIAKLRFYQIHSPAV